MLLFAAEMERNAALTGITDSTILSANVGIGLANSVAGTTKILCDCKPTGVVFLGSCGSYTDKLQIGDCVVAQSVKLISTDLMNNTMRLPTLIQQEINCELEINKNYFSKIVRLEKLINTRVANTLGVTEDKDIGDKFHRLCQVDTENLEAFGVATACELLNVPYMIILGVTNYVQETGGKDWFSNFKTVLKNLTEKIIL